MSDTGPTGPTEPQETVDATGPTGPEETVDATGPTGPEETPPAPAPAPVIATMDELMASHAVLVAKEAADRATLNRRRRTRPHLHTLNE